MSKKIFKAIILGLMNLEDSKLILITIFGTTSLPIFTMLSICAIFKIDLTDDELMIMALFSVFVGINIFAFLLHCWNAKKYREKHNCDCYTAWKATEHKPGNDDEF